MTSSRLILLGGYLLQPLVLAASLLVAAVLPAAELKINVSSFPPGLELKPGVAVLLSVDGLEPGQVATWHRVAVEGDVVLKLDAYHLFAGTAPGPRTFIVQVASPGADPFAIATFNYGDTDENPPIPPLPSNVAGVLILEEQDPRDPQGRTAAQARIIDDPVWQTAAISKGLTYQIEDDDNPAIAKHLAAAGSERPVVCFLDSDGKVVAVKPFPATVEAMRALIGGLK